MPAAVRPGRTDDLRDDVAGALDDHVVAFADALAVDVLLVVQRRARDRDAADLTGSIIAHGLSAPVRPTRIRISSSRVDAVIGAHLYALAHRGRWWRTPRRRCWSSESTLITIAVDLVVELDAALLPLDARCGDLLDRLEPLGERVRAEAALAQPREHLRLRLELDSLAVRRRRRPRSASGRSAVIDAFFWRSEPAAALRGFGASFCVVPASRSFSSLKPLRSGGRPRRAPRSRAGGIAVRRSGIALIVRMLRVTSSP